jgi:glucokinase
MKALGIDLGGTNANAGIVDFAEGRPRLVAKVSAPTASLPSLEPWLRDFILGLPAKDRPAAACLAGAGIVEGDTIVMSNVALRPSAKLLEAAIGAPLRLSNDFQALSRAVALFDRGDSGVFLDLGEQPTAPEEDRGGGISRHSGIAHAKCITCVLGAGTGLGMSYLRLGPSGRAEILPGEGGTARLPVWDGESARFALYLGEALGAEPVAEDFLSGRGIASYHEFLAKAEGLGDGSGILALDPARRPQAISEASARDTVCARSMARFAEGFALVARDGALTLLASGGAVVAGGIAAKNLGLFANKEFPRRFRTHPKAECARFLATVPLRAVVDYSISVLGAAALALEGPEAQGGRDVGPAR